MPIVPDRHPVGRTAVRPPREKARKIFKIISDQIGKFGNKSKSPAMFTVAREF
jgi:hypothetical protein